LAQKLKRVASELLFGFAYALVLAGIWGVFVLRRAEENPIGTGIALAALAVLGGARQVQEFPRQRWWSMILGVVAGMVMACAFVLVRWFPKQEVYRSYLTDLTPIIFWPAGMLFAHWFWSRRRGRSTSAVPRGAVRKN